MVCGKAFALYVLLMSLSDRLSDAIGFEYMNSFSFAVCGVVVIVFLALIKHLKSRWARLAFAVAELAFIVLWCALVCYLRWFSMEGSLPPLPVLLMYAAGGRLVTLFANIQWNFHFSLNGIEEAARSTIASVLIAIALFLGTTFVGDSLTTFMIVVALTVSGVLNLALELMTARQPHCAYAVEAVERADARTPVAERSLPRTRLLYFGARVLYGMALGFVVGAVALAQSVGSGPLPIVAMVTLGLALAIVGVWRFCSDGEGALYLISVLPIACIFAVVTSFYSDGISNLARIFAMMVEVAWTVQNLFQLPSYRRMTGMKTSSFAYYEYAAQVIPFYFVAWTISSNISVLPFAADPLEIARICCGCMIVLAGFSVLAMVWHVVRYYPARTMRIPVRLGGNSNGSQEAERSIPDILTPREREVFALLAEGYSRPYIAKTLYISVDTVKVHVKHIYAKLGVDSQDDLIELARVGCISRRG